MKKRNKISRENGGFLKQKRKHEKRQRSDKQGKGISKNIVIAIVLIACIASGITITVLLWEYSIAEIREIPMTFYVEEKAAFNTDTDAIYFGSAPRGSSAVRGIKVDADEEMVVTALATGNISGILRISENSFIVGPGKSKEITLVVTAPEDDEYITTYAGTLKLVFRRF